jgi:hypothetical protein
MFGITLCRLNQVPLSEVLKNELKFFIKFGTHVKEVRECKNSSQSDSVNKSSSRSRSANNLNNESIGFRMSLKNLHKIPRDDEAFDKI